MPKSLTEEAAELRQLGAELRARIDYAKDRGLTAWAAQLTSMACLCDAHATLVEAAAAAAR